MLLGLRNDVGKAICHLNLIIVLKALVEVHNKIIKILVLLPQ